MAKRLHDTARWSNPNFSNLPQKMKLFFLWAWDNADPAGVFYLNEEIVKLFIGEAVTEADIEKHLSAMMIKLKPRKYIIYGFITFINGDLNASKAKVAQSVKNTILTHGLWEEYMRGTYGPVNRAISHIP